MDYSQNIKIKSPVTTECHRRRTIMRTDSEITKPSMGVSANAAPRLGSSELTRILADLSALKMEELRGIVTEHITSIYNVRTPKDKIKKRPDGLDYIESTWMDKTWKEFSPLYSYSLVYVNESSGWIDVIVSLEDKTSGNVELGAGSARIQVRRGTEDIVDKSNNIKSALTGAIKNAQSRFGVGADVYGKREQTRSDEEVSRFKQMSIDIKRIDPSRTQMFENQWNDLGVDFTEFLDRWQMFIDKNQASAEKASGRSNNSGATVTEESLFNQKTSNVSNAAGMKKQIKI